MRTLALFATALLAAGCVTQGFDPGPGGGDDEPTTPSTGAKALYQQDVHPVMMLKCGSSGCHGQVGVTGVYGFATADKESSYNQVVSVPTLVGTYTPVSAGIVTEIKQAGGHNGMTYTATEDAAIAAWLAAELEERQGAGPIIDPVEELRKWSGCMSLENFEASVPPMATAWGQLATDTTLQRCANCHQAGLDSFLSGNGQAEPFFNGLTSQKEFLLKYFTVDGTGKVIINTAAMTNAGVTLVGHPRFNATTNNGMTALKSFYDLTVARQTANLCDPPRLPMQ